MTDPHDLGYSDYIVYVDESGDHGLTSIDPQFPVFALTFCVFRKSDYIEAVVPAVQRIKFGFWGHDAVVLHETDIRKQAGAFGILRSDPALRAAFFDELTAAIAAADFGIIASVIDKQRHRARYRQPQNPYEIALLFCMERLLKLLLDNGQAGRRVHVVFESRGQNEDRMLEAEFRRICDNGALLHRRRNDFRRVEFVPHFRTKPENSTGLQLADLTARPIALSVIRPDQPNRSYDTIRPKVIERKVFP